MISYFNGVAQLRQHIKKSHRVHGVILDGGKAANIIPDYTHARFYTRATTRKELDILTERVNQIARVQPSKRVVTMNLVLFKMV